ncbi:hypothetical protein [Lachnoclostridium phytofermentans]|uniref:Uncharacterized protein n=1 Tax=Lachnoclostridium phytofermentans (strain ATCC 700394 / DSM 18823 / ISDg) TaxID=357809 RepID=A9KRA6_LACP7|nr:hypothetical protein [Lachnoclostridium phytofermentans]ABX40574.1 hypothetical protein Cphy_0187 [Lachnoclostridium phytofermentans ISDg]
MKLGRAFKFQMKEIIKSIATFYGFLFLFLFLFITISNNSGDRNGSIGGFELFTMVMIFITMLNIIRSDFHLFLQHGYSRKTLFLSTILCIITTSSVVALMESILFKIFSHFVTYNGMYIQGYGAAYLSDVGVKGMVDEYFWKFFLYILAGAIGIFISLLYYRMNKLQKMIVSAGVPALLFVIYPISDEFLFDGALSKISAKIMNFYTGYAFGSEPYVNVLCNIALFALFGAFSFLLLRRCNYKK